MNLSAGKLRDRVTFKQKTWTQDEAGQPVETPYIDLAVNPTRWANVKFLNGKEFISSDKTTAGTDVSIRLRHCTDITPAMIAVFKNKIYNITAVLPNGTNEWVDVVAMVGYSDN